MLLNIRVLSVQQPWAWAIIHGGKDIENRQWRSHYRGPLAIHAGKRIMRDSFGEFLKKTGLKRVPAKALATGAIIGVVEMVDCIEKSRSKWFGGKYGFVVRNATPCRPVPLLGKLRVFEERLSDAGLIKAHSLVTRLAKQRAHKP